MDSHIPKFQTTKHKQQYHVQFIGCILKEREYTLISLTLPSFVLLLEIQMCCLTIFVDANKNSLGVAEQQERRILDP